MIKRTLGLVSILFSAAAIASPSQTGSAQQGLSFGEIRAACENPARYHNQIAPANIQISCLDVQYRWVPDADGAVTMPTSRRVTSSLISDKYTVSPVTAAVPSAHQVSACANFKQISETVEVVHSVSCEEMITYTGSSTDFCASATSALRGVNAEAIRVADTGRTVSLCGARDSAADDRGQRDEDRGQRKQRP